MNQNSALHQANMTLVAVGDNVLLEFEIPTPPWMS